jgi:hypothetical protein
MHCKKCDAVFYLDATGKPKIGEPPSAKGAKKKGQREENEPLDPIGIVAEKLVKVPRPIYYTLGGLLSVYLLYVIYSSMGSRPRPASADFAEKNLYATTAFIDKDISTLKSLATSDSQDEAAKLVEVIRPLVGDKDGKGTSYEVTASAVSFPDPLGDEPHVEMALQAPPLPDGKAPPIFTLELIWIKGAKKYFLNGKATLEANELREKARQDAIAAAKAKRR